MYLHGALWILRNRTLAGLGNRSPCRDACGIKGGRDPRGSTGGGPSLTCPFSMCRLLSIDLTTSPSGVRLITAVDSHHISKKEFGLPGL